MKKYGDSILQNNEVNVESNNSGFDLDVNTEDIDSMRKQISKNPKKKDVVSTDPISGIKSAVKATEESSKFSDIMNNRQIKGKKINISGINIIKQLINKEPDSDILNNMTDVFDRIDNVSDIKDMDIDDIEECLGDEISDTIKTKVDDENKYDAVIRRYIEQLYVTYVHEIQYNDDISTLSKAMSALKNVESSAANIDDNFDSLMNMQNQLNNILSMIDDMNVDEYSKKDYSIDDIDIYLMGSVAKCLEEATSFSRLYSKVNTSKSKFVKDLKDRKSCIKNISNWIKDLMNDDDTLYSFPMEYESKDNIGEEFIEFIFKVILIQSMSNYHLENDITDIVEFYREKGYLDKATEKKLRNISYSFVYVLTKTFKLKNIKSEDDRRILSYTLDIISKSMMKSYRKTFVDMCNDLYEKLYK